MNAKQRRKLVRKHKEAILHDIAVCRFAGRRSIYDIMNIYTGLYKGHNLQKRADGGYAHTMYRTALLLEYTPTAFIYHQRSIEREHERTHQIPDHQTQ